MLSMATTLLTLTALHVDGGFFRDAAGRRQCCCAASTSPATPRCRRFAPSPTRRSSIRCPASGSTCVRLLFTVGGVRAVARRLRRLLSGLLPGRRRRGGGARAVGRRRLPPGRLFARVDRRLRRGLPVVGAATDGDAGYARQRRRRAPTGANACSATPTLKSTWDAFYADSNGARTRYLAMIARVAAALAGQEQRRRLRPAERARRRRAHPDRAALRRRRARRPRRARDGDPLRLTRLSDQRRRRDPPRAPELRHTSPTRRTITIRRCCCSMAGRAATRAPRSAR